MLIKKVAVLGGGNGGITAALDLREKGYEVSLYSLPDYANKLNRLKKNGKAELVDVNGMRTIMIDFINDDIVETIKNADVIMVIIPGIAVEAYAEVLAPVVKENQLIFFNGAAAMSCVRFCNHAKKMNITKKFKLCESNSLSYGTRYYDKEFKVEISLYVKKLFLSGYPQRETGSALEMVSQLYSGMVSAANIWHTTLENGNPVVHPGPSLLNAGRIDYSKGEFWLYKEGITEHTINILRGVESEQMEIGKKFGFVIEDATQCRARRGYLANEEDDLQHQFNNSVVFSKIKGPLTCDSRYFKEDIAIGLVLWSDLGKVASVSTPNIDAIITLAGTLLKVDFWSEGVTLDKLGFGGKNLTQLIESV